ncbi:MAG TPA: hypothetical protein VFW65_13815 [Pseudonocardiaceae bacterium]|nr:hypothetical protein [Pseudonocardiaceae bacterium]
MRLTLPADATLVDLARPDHAAPRLAATLDQLRNQPSLAAETDMLARQMIEEVTRAGGYLFAVLGDGATLTGANAPGTPDWTGEYADALRWRLDDTGHETITVDTPLGPVVVAERVTAGIVQLQAFLAEPGCPDIVVITLTAPSGRSQTHRMTILDIVHTAGLDGPR